MPHQRTVRGTPHEAANELLMTALATAWHAVAHSATRLVH